MKLLLPALFLMFSGCISISTYEQRMKTVRSQAAELEAANAKLAALQIRNTDLEKALEGKSEEISNVRGTYEELVQELKDSIASGEVGVSQDEKGLTITMGNQILFASGKSDLQPKGKKVLMQVAGIIKKANDRMIQVEGHTDNQKIVGSLKSRFPSNWDLSAARSASVVRYLQEEGGIDPALLVLTAYAENQPISDNATPQGRQENRRVEIILVPKKP